MKNKIQIRFLLSLALILSLVTISLPQTVFAQNASGAAKTAEAGDLQKRLAKIEAKLEARRKELGIPGLSLAIVKDGEVVLSKGYGYKNFEKQIPVTGETQFAIGSATKAFTALSVLMSQDAGKLSLDDSPKKYLSYFKINDPEIDKNITVRDLLAHSSGLNRTDLAMITGKLTREELIRVVGEARPTAKLREKFQYQNMMYTAAGEAVAKVQGKTWEAFVAQDILKPLGMLNSSVSVVEMQKAKDYSYGYDYNFDTKLTRNLPTREIAEVAPAGSINSSSNDMAKWLKFILNKGEINGKRFVSEKSFEEWIKPQQKIGGNSSYGLGWFLQNWKGKKLIQHGGNIDGFNSMVALIPEENIGFVMLTNVSASSLGNELMAIVWENMLGELKDESPNPAVSGEAKKEVGKYNFPQAGFDIEVKIEDGKLVAIVPNQPTYILEKVEGRKYKLTNAPEGFFITFKDDSAFLEQPQGNATLTKISADAKKETESSEPAKELLGKYESQENKGSFIEIKEVSGKVSLVVGNQPPYPLVEKEKNVFSSPSLPDTYSIKVRRGAENKLEGIIVSQPEGEFPFNFVGKGEIEENPKEIFGTYKLDQPPAYNVEISKRDGKIYLQVPNQPQHELQEKEKDVYFSPTIPDVLKKVEIKRDTDGNVVAFISNEPGGIFTFKKIKVEKPKITVDELMEKAIAALGGAENLKKINSREMSIEIDFIHQGVKGIGKSYAKAPNLSASSLKVMALGKEIATIDDYFNGTSGGSVLSFMPDDTLTGQRLEDAKFNNDFYWFVNWKEKIKKAEITGMEKVGDEEVYILVIEPEKASKITFHISTKTFLTLMRTTIVSSSTSSQKIPIAETYSDYREINGVLIPFKIVQENPGMGQIVTYVKDVKHNTPIDDQTFAPKDAKKAVGKN